MALGALGKLTMTLQQYRPTVQCLLAPTEFLALTACQVILDEMLTTTTSQTFGQHGDPDVDVPLPRRFVSRMLTIHRVPDTIEILTASTAIGDCAITLLMNGPPVPMTWHKIWGAAVAVAGMWARGAKPGTATLECRSRKVSTSVDGRADGLISRQFHD